MIVWNSVLPLLMLLVSACVGYSTPNDGIDRFVADPTHAPHLGGPLYRVFDVDEIDSIDALHAVEAIYRSAEACTEIERDFVDVRVFFTSKIMLQTENGWSDGFTAESRFVGMRTWDRPWIYLLRNRDIDQIAWTLKHEFVHYLTDLGHPESDDALRACDVHREAKTQ